MGFWDELDKDLDDVFKNSDDPITDALGKVRGDLKKILTEQADSERVMERLISDPEALNRFSLQELEHQRITVQSELERIQEDIRKQEAKVKDIDSREPYLTASDRLKRSFAKTQVEKHKERARKRTLLINLIEAKKNAPKKPTPPLPPAKAPSPEEIRARKKAEILARLERLPVEEQQMVATTNDEDMKRLIENMYADKRSKLMEELSKWI